MAATGPPPPRVVTLVLCRRDGEVVGALAPFEVAVPWWPEVASVVDVARERHGVDVVVLRLLHADGSVGGAGGPVTYLAELDGGAQPDTELWPGRPNADEALRAPWARPGGPAADLAWADAALARAGHPRSGPARQVRTWNLSSLWRLPTTDGAVWLKVVPSFFAHEGAVVSRLPPSPVPEVIAFESGRLLLAEVPGEDQYGASGESLVHMVDLLVSLQARWAARTSALLALGVPDWGGPALCDALPTLLDRNRATLEPAATAILDVVMHDLPARFEELSACGLPDTLVHGDFHPGNVRGADDHLVVLDWGDSGVGHPMLDQAAFLERRSDDERSLVRARWSQRWQEEVPGSDPDRAAVLIEPVAALRQALIYQCFLDRIEPDERIYHASDPATWLHRAAALVSGTPD